MQTCYSHPSKLLIDHLTKVRDYGLYLFNSDHSYFDYDRNVLRNVLENILFLHDFGKATSYFQNYLQAKINNLEYGEKEELKNHARISALYAAYKTFKETSSQFLALICYVVILKHHSDLQNFVDMINISKSKIKILKKQYASINWNAFQDKHLELYPWEKLQCFLEELWILYQEVENKLEDFFLLKYFYSILLYSDKNEAAFSALLDETVLPAKCIEWIPEFKKQKFSQREITVLNRLREQIYRQAIENQQVFSKVTDILFLNVPTGLGKTLTGLQVAILMVNQDTRLKKIIYAVPFTSIIDQTGDIIEEILAMNNLQAANYYTKHHHLIEPKIRIDEALYEGEKGQFLIENWDKPLILTTFWQIFNTIYYGRNRLNRKFHQLANSVIILDEIQTLPLEYWDIIRETLEILTKHFHCKIIYMTATLPLLFKKREVEKHNLITIDQKSLLRQLNRYTIHILNQLQHIDFSTFTSHLAKTITQNPSKRILIVLNTIRQSQMVYRWIKENINKSVEYLSTNIIPKDRSLRIRNIKNNPANQILVSTQLIEAGVDLDFDIVYRDMAPMDSIIQTAGRCNRNMIGQGLVFLFSLKDDKNNRDFASYVYSDLSLHPTRALLNRFHTIHEDELPELLDEYYLQVVNRSSTNQYERIKQHLLEGNFESLEEEFKLIKNLPEQLLFIEKDENAMRILDEYFHIRDKYQGLERRDSFLKIKKEFYEYVLSVKISSKTIGFLNAFNEAGNFLVLPREMADQYYLPDIGLYLEVENFL